MPQRFLRPAALVRVVAVSAATPNPSLPRGARARPLSPPRRPPALSTAQLNRTASHEASRGTEKASRGAEKASHGVTKTRNFSVGIVGLRQVFRWLVEQLDRAG
jgi:hypothetical protein